MSDRTLLIKFGGSSLSGEGDLDRFSSDVAQLRNAGMSIVIVHGGGPEINEAMERKGLKVHKVSGLRITDDASLDVVCDVLSSINSHIVASLSNAGVNAIGLSASEEGMVVCEKKPPVHTEEGDVDLGNVGEVRTVCSERLMRMLSDGAVPVIYPICADATGKKYNVNADTVAAHIAKAVHAKEMVLVTDVPGILINGEKGKQVLHEATMDKIDELISTGIIIGGMLPKVEACRTALDSGVSTVYMLNGKEPHSLLAKLINGQECGTKITSRQ